MDEYEQKGPHVAAAERMKAKKIPVGQGTLIKYVIVQGSEMIRDRARLLEEVKEGEYDSEYYINNQVVPAVDRIFTVLGYKKDDLIRQKDQSQLDKFF